MAPGPARDGSSVATRGAGVDVVAENEAQMRAMIATHDNDSQSLSDLAAKSRRLRQKEITDEITKLATSRLPVR